MARPATSPNAQAAGTEAGCGNRHHADGWRGLSLPLPAGICQHLGSYENWRALRAMGTGGTGGIYRPAPDASGPLAGKRQGTRRFPGLDSTPLPQALASDISPEIGERDENKAEDNQAAR